MAKINYTRTIWSASSRLRRHYDLADYHSVILPFVLLRFMECRLKETKPKVLRLASKKKLVGKVRVDQLKKAAGFDFYNTSVFDLDLALSDPSKVRSSLQSYLTGFSSNVRDIFNGYDFSNQLVKLDQLGLLIPTSKHFAKIDLSPELVSSEQMAEIFAELVQKSVASSPKTLGGLNPPSDLSKLAVNLLLDRDIDELQQAEIEKTIYDPIAGFSENLFAAKQYLKALNPSGKFLGYGQEADEVAWSIAQSMLLIRQEPTEDFDFGDSLTEDTHTQQSFDYAVAITKPYSHWRDIKKTIAKEHSNLAFSGRFGPGLPSSADSALLYLMHLVSKMKPAALGGARVAIVVNESPLVAGSSGSGESSIRRFLLESDLIEAVIKLPEGITYNNPESRYLMILDNDKSMRRKGKIHLIDASKLREPNRPLIQDKKYRLGEKTLSEISKRYEGFEQTPLSQILSIEHFGYKTHTVNQPLRRSWIVTEEKLLSLGKLASFKKLLPDLQALDSQLLAGKVDTSKYLDREQLIAKLEELIPGLANLLESQLEKVLSHFLETDLGGFIVTDKSGNPVADATLTQKVKVSLAENTDEYLAKHLGLEPDEFWVEKTDERIGFEISFPRAFAKPPKKPFSWPSLKSLLPVITLPKKNIADSEPEQALAALDEQSVAVVEAASPNSETEQQLIETPEPESLEQEESLELETPEQVENPEPLETESLSSEDEPVSTALDGSSLPERKRFTWPTFSLTALVASIKAKASSSPKEPVEDIEQQAEVASDFVAEHQLNTGSENTSESLPNPEPSTEEQTDSPALDLVNQSDRKKFSWPVLPKWSQAAKGPVFEELAHSLGEQPDDSADSQFEAQVDSLPDVQQSSELLDQQQTDGSTLGKGAQQGSKKFSVAALVSLLKNSISSFQKKPKDDIEDLAAPSSESITDAEPSSTQDLTPAVEDETASATADQIVAFDKKKFSWPSFDLAALLAFLKPKKTTSEVEQTKSPDQTDDHASDLATEVHLELSPETMAEPIEEPDSATADQIVAFERKKFSWPSFWFPKKSSNKFSTSEVSEEDADLSIEEEVESALATVDDNSSPLPSWLLAEEPVIDIPELPTWLVIDPQTQLASFEQAEPVKPGPRQLVGEGLLTVGFTMVLFLGWYLFLNDAIQSGTQREAASGLSKSWSDFIPLPNLSPSSPETKPTDMAPPVINPGSEGQVFALLYVPRFGDDYIRKIGEGVDLDKVLNSRTIGVGRYPQSDPLGANGNFAVAGHRNTWGAAFGEIGELRLGDRIYVEVKEGWYSYKFRNLEYVWSSETDVLNAFPRLGDQPADERIITLTSCHPKFSEAERIIAYGIYEGWYPRENGPPTEIQQLVKGTS